MEPKKPEQEAQAPRVELFDADEDFVDRGERIKLVWSVEGAVTVRIEPKPGFVAAKGSYHDEMGTADIDYRLIATAPNGKVTIRKKKIFYAGGSDPLPPAVPGPTPKQESTQRTPASVASPPHIADFSAHPRMVQRGGNTKLLWSVLGATAVDIVDEDGIGVDSYFGDKTSGRVETRALLKTTLLTLTARSETGETATRQITVDVVDRLPDPPSIELHGPAEAPAGTNATVRWQVRNADRVLLVVDGRSEEVPLAGSQPVMVMRPATVEVVAESTRGTERKSMMIAVLQTVAKPISGRPDPQVSAFVAQPAQIVFGDVTELLWTVTGLGAEREIVVGIHPEPGRVSSSGRRQVYPQSTTTYTLTVTKAGASAPCCQATCRVEVQPVRPLIPAFHSNLKSIAPGGKTELHWQVLGASEVEINGHAVPPEGSLVVTPAATTTYTLRANSAAGSSHARLTIRVSRIAPGFYWLSALILLVAIAMLMVRRFLN